MSARKVNKQVVTFKKSALAVAISMAMTSMAYANPTGLDVVSGQATTQALGDLLKVTNTPGAVLNWQQFNIDAGQTTQFVQQNAASQVFNRVVGGNVSQILGTLKSNGQVFLINPAGIIFGQGSQVNTAGFVASALAASTADLINGHLKFESDPTSNALIQNLGNLTASDGGSIVLIAPNIKNSGIIQTNGEIMLAAGHKVTIVDLNHPTVGLNVEAQAGAQAINLGQIVGQQVSVFGSLIQNTGVVEATGVEKGTGGVIRFVAQDKADLQQGSTLKASGNVSGGQVSVSASQGDVVSAGHIEAKGQSGQGGRVDLIGNRVAVTTSSTVNVNGGAGGGSIHIGGGWQGKDASLQNSRQTVIQSGAKISANATDSGNGGEVVAFSDGNTTVDAQLQARGGANGGDGGRVETSAKQRLSVSQAADTSAPKGRAGQWLLDPANMYVVSALPTSSPPPQTVPPPNPSSQPANLFTTDGQTGDSYILNSTVVQGLQNNGSVVLSTVGTSAGNGDMTINAPILVNDPTAFPSPALTLDAQGTLSINSAIGIDPTATGFSGFDLDLSYNINQPVFVNAPLYLGGTGILTLAPFNVAAPTSTIGAYVDGVNFLSGSSGSSLIPNLITSAPLNGQSGALNAVPIVRMDGANLQIDNMTGDINNPPGIDLRLLNASTLTVGQSALTDAVTVSGNSSVSLSNGFYATLDTQNLTVDQGSSLAVTGNSALAYGLGNLNGNVSITANGSVSGIDTNLNGTLTLSGDPNGYYSGYAEFQSLGMGSTGIINLGPATNLFLGKAFNSYSSTTPITQKNASVPLSSSGGQFVAQSGAQINLNGLNAPGIFYNVEQVQRGPQVDITDLDAKIDTPVTFNVSGFNSEITSNDITSTQTSLSTMTVGPQTQINVNGGTFGPSLRVGQGFYSRSPDEPNARFDPFTTMGLKFSGGLNVSSGGAELYGKTVTTVGSNVLVSGTNSGVKLNGVFTTADITSLTATNGARIALTGLWDNSAVNASNAQTTSALNKTDLAVVDNLTIKGGLLTSLDPASGLSAGHGILVKSGGFVEFLSNTISSDVWLGQGSAAMLASRDETQNPVADVALPTLAGAKFHLMGDAALVIGADSTGLAQLNGTADILSSGQGNLTLAGRAIYDPNNISTTPDAQALFLSPGITFRVQDNSPPTTLTTGLGLVYPNGPSTVPARPSMLIGQLTEQAVANYEVEHTGNDFYTGAPLYATTDLINPTTNNPTPGFPSGATSFTIDGKSDSYAGGTNTGINGTAPTVCSISDLCVKFGLNQSVVFGGTVISELTPNVTTNISSSGLAFSSGLNTALNNINYIQSTPTEFRYLNGTFNFDPTEVAAGQTLVNNASLNLINNGKSNVLSNSIVNNNNLNVDGVYQLSGSLGGTGNTFLTGNLTLNSTSPFTIDNTLINTGVLLNQSNVTLNTNLQGTGTFNNLGTFTLASITAGTIDNTITNNGTLNNVGFNTLNTTLMGNGVVNNSVSLTLNNATAGVLDNTFNNTGTLTNQTTNTLNTVLGGNGQFVNNGTFTLANTSGATINNTITNNGALINLGNSVLATALGGTGSFLNSGTLTFADTSGTTDNNQITNNGQLVNVGNLSLGKAVAGSGNINNTGNLTFNDASGAVLTNTLNNAGIVTNNGTMSYATGISGTGLFANAGTLSLTDTSNSIFSNVFSNTGVATNLGTYTFANGFSSAGSLQNNGTLNFAAATSNYIASGASNNGTVNNAGSLALGALYSGTGSFVNTGKLLVTDDPQVTAAQSGGSTQLLPSATASSFDNNLTNQAGGSLTLSGALSGLNFTKAFNNDGAINILPGTYQFAQGYSQSGGGAVAFAPGVNVAGNVKLSGPTAILKGNSTINGSLTVVGATVSPGNSPGLVTINGDFTLDSQSLTKIEFQSNGGVPGVDYDFIQVNGNANLAGTLQLVDISSNGAGGGLTTPSSFKFIQANAFNGAFGTISKQNLTGAYTFTDPVQVAGNGSQVALQISAQPALPATNTSTGATVNQQLDSTYQAPPPPPPPPSSTTSDSGSGSGTTDDQAKQSGEQTTSSTTNPPPPPSNRDVIFQPRPQNNQRIGSNCR